MSDVRTRTIRIANAPCSWGALEFDVLRPDAGQPRAQSRGVGDAVPYEQVLDEMAASGFVGTELGDWGFMPSEPAPLRAALALRHLDLVGAFVPVALKRSEAHANGRDTALRVARLLAASSDSTPVIVLSDANLEIPERANKAGRITHADSLSPREWDTFARGATDIARAVRDETGLRTVFHPHCGGYVEAPWELEALLDRTDASLLGVCLDTGHLTFGGGDPVDIARRHARRIWHVHVKDCDPQVAMRSRADRWDYLTAVGHGVFCELGRGQVDFPAVLAALDAADYAGWIVVEQDVLPGLGRPVDSATRNRAYLSHLGL